MPNNPSNSAAPATGATANNTNNPSIPFPTSDNPPPLVEQVQEKTTDTIQPVVEKLAAIKEQAASTLSSGASQAMTKLGEHSERLYISQAKLLDTCRVQVRKQPMTMLAIAVATVVALGVLFGRQTR